MFACSVARAVPPVSSTSFGADQAPLLTDHRQRRINWRARAIAPHHSRAGYQRHIAEPGGASFAAMAGGWPRGAVPAASKQRAGPFCYKAAMLTNDILIVP